MTANFNIPIAEVFLRKAVELLGNSNESTMRHLLSSYLPQMFPDSASSWWVELHAKGSETRVNSSNEGKIKRGFIDTLVGSTVIEYEKDLSNIALALHGEEQVREYCAGLFNAGVPQSNIIGVLSDTVRWRAFLIKEIKENINNKGIVGYQDIILEEVDSMDLISASTDDAINLGRFLIKYLGRVGGRTLSAKSLAFDFGFKSDVCLEHLRGVHYIVDDAFTSSPDYSSLIENIWSDFVSYLGDSCVAGQFNRDSYVSELYILTLAKLLCANVLEGKALISNDLELIDILNGSFFQDKGFSNLIEFDYFGWLNQEPHVTMLLDISKQIQVDLTAYDFQTAPAEDLFGDLMAQLSMRSQRLLLGQEWTPSWLSNAIVESVFQNLPEGQDPRFVDMCCGSGSMIVETVKQTIMRFIADGVKPDAKSVSRLSQAITGFDIDPLAVMLAKVSWILAAKDWLAKAGAFDVSLPIFHADSLFVSTPVSKKICDDGIEYHTLDLDGHQVLLPKFLVSPQFASLFDELISISYCVAMEAAKSESFKDVTNLANTILLDSCNKFQYKLNDDQTKSIVEFLCKLLKTLEGLQRAGRNGIWAFVLGNSYRPGLVSGQFNGLVSNPPWLAMSKIADNPYKASVVNIAESHNIKPSGSSHLHAELATIFLLNAVSRYLTKGSVIGCVLPESVTSAHHHNSFRKGDYLTAKKPVELTVDELWYVEKGTFKNEAIVLFGSCLPIDTASSTKAKLITRSGKSDLDFHVISQGSRTAWSNMPVKAKGTGFFSPANFRQGADVFPRTAIFHELSIVGSRVDMLPINKVGSESAYLVKGAKKHKDFSISAKGINAKYFFDIAMSNHLTPFNLAEPAKGFLPLENNGGQWAPATNVGIKTAGRSTSNAFDKFFGVIDCDSQGYFDVINTPRNKLSVQSFPETGWLVVMGAGGKLVCAAFEAISNFERSKLIIDQTLYWAVVHTEDEALYLTGLLNSEAINIVIQQFQPRGQFGERHIHTLPLGATPKFNPLEVAHVDVVSKTRILLEQWKVDIATNPSEFDDLLNLNKRLSNRRSSLRKRLIQLPGYDEYDLACRNLYAV